MRDLLLPGGGRRRRGTATRCAFRLEYALVITFLYGQHYACNEYCKYYKNLENTGYKFIPAVHRTYYDGSASATSPASSSISQAEFEAMPPPFDGDWLREHFPDVAASMDNFIDKVKERPTASSSATSRSPASRSTSTTPEHTSRRWHESGLDHPLARTPVFLLGDSAIGSPYFQSISLGLECAFFLAGHIGQPWTADRP